VISATFLSAGQPEPTVVYYYEMRFIFHQFIW